jgi:CysZ protein
VYAVVCEVKRLALIVGVFLLLLPLHLLPGVGSVLYLALSFAWACWCGALEFTGYAADRRHMGLRRKLAMIRRNLAPCMGFGLATVALLMIPFVNVFMVPVSAVGGTLLFGMIQKAQRSPC